MGHVCPHHLESDLFLSHYFEPVPHSRRVSVGNRRAGGTSSSVNAVRDSLVLVLIFEGFMDALCDGFAVEDEAFGDWRLQMYNS